MTLPEPCMCGAWDCPQCFPGNATACRGCERLLDDLAEVRTELAEAEADLASAELERDALRADVERLRTMLFDEHRAHLDEFIPMLDAREEADALLAEALRVGLAECERLRALLSSTAVRP